MNKKSFFFTRNFSLLVTAVLFHSLWEFQLLQAFFLLWEFYQYSYFIQDFRLTGNFINIHITSRTLGLLEIAAVLTIYFLPGVLLWDLPLYLLTFRIILVKNRQDIVHHLHISYKTYGYDLWLFQDQLLFQWSLLITLPAVHYQLGEQ